MQEYLPSPIEEVREEEWEKTPESVKRLVKSLVARVAQLEQQYEELKTEHQLLQEQVKQNSQNSSKPPSQEVSKGFKPKERHKSGKQRGAQPGHEGHERHFYSLEQCQRVENHRPDVCGYCGRRLHGEDPQPYRVQIVEIPPVVPIIDEHRFHQLECSRCGALTRAWDEAIINGSGYGERVVAYVGLLRGQYRQSHRMVQQLLSDCLGIKISVGSINQLRQEMAAAVGEAVAEAQQYIQGESQVNIDETSFAQSNSDGKNPNGRKGWLWVMVTPLVSYKARVSQSFPSRLSTSVG